MPLAAAQPLTTCSSHLKPGTGWLIPPAVLHAPGSLVTYEPQWGSDVFGMYQSLVEGRRVPWELLVKDVPERRLDATRRAVELLGDPQRAYPIIHVTGTNGKTSTSRPGLTPTAAATSTPAGCSASTQAPTSTPAPR